jgi:prepilin-type N-terminal cleavage/methylation domain-containing protein/prepilin-type processing-associated H-X9-DG protein
LCRPHARPAFTLIELLVVMAIISILVGLLMPAIQKAREAAAQTQCRNNLKQIGLAIHQYEGFYRIFPPSRMSDVHATWAVFILPYLEQQQLYNLWDINNFYYNQVPQAIQTPVPLYFCPSRRTATMGPTLSLSIGGGGDVNDDPVVAPAGPVPGALGDYAANIGTSPCDGVMDCAGFLQPPNSAPNGPFRPWFDAPPSWNALYKMRPAHVTDGMSNTIFIGEKHVMPSNWGIGGMNLDWAPNSSDCSLWNGDYLMCSSRPVGWNYPLAQYPEDSNQNAGFGSYHPNVVQFLFGDGSVRTVTVQTSPALLAILADIADGNVNPIVDF